MEIYFNGAVMQESEFRAYQQSINGPTWDATTPEILEALGASVLLEGPQATCDRYQFSMRQGVEQIDGKWYTKYVAGPIFTDKPAEGDQPAQTAAEQEAAYKAQKDAEQADNIRKQRNTLLADWVDRMNPLVWEVMTDDDKNGYRAYRKALLDIPNQTGFPWTVDWPETPTELAKKN